MVFAGYGITAPEYNYDDYAGLDVRGKFVVVLAHEPQEYDEKSIFAGKVYTDHAQYYSKAANARRHGAVGVILIADRVNHKTSADELEPFGKTTGPNDAGILFVQVKQDVVESWFRAAGKDLHAGGIRHRCGCQAPLIRVARHRSARDRGRRARRQNRA